MIVNFILLDVIGEGVAPPIPVAPGAYDFNLVTNELIEEAFDVCGIGAEGEAITADMYSRGTRSLNLIIKTWQANDHLWQRTEGGLDLVAGQASYSVGTITPKPMRVLSIRRKVNNIEVPLWEMSRQEYFDQSNKATQSVPTSFYYDPQAGTGTIYLWPTPSAQTVTNTTLRLTYLRRLADFDASDGDPDIPQEWLQPLVYALAAQLALKYGVAPDIRSEIEGRAEMLYSKLSGWDNEPASIYLQPEYRWC